MKNKNFKDFKTCRKEAREYMTNQGHGISVFISFSKNKGYYYTESEDNYALYYMRPNGTVEVLKTNYAIRFFSIQKQRKNQNGKRQISSL